MQATITKTRDAVPPGTCAPTEVDARKAAAAFRLTGFDGKRNCIVWANGTHDAVTDKQLAKLQARFAWACDF